MKKLLIRLSVIPLMPVLGGELFFNLFYWLITGKIINFNWTENWLNSVESEMKW